MKISGIEAAKISEGKAQAYVPKASLSDPHHCEVFYNPAMAFSRTLSSLAFAVLAKRQLPKPVRLLDGLCATGIRGIRYAKESGTRCEVTFCDANELAIAYAKRNAALNKLEKASLRPESFHETAALERFDFVELDPFGTPTVFLDAAVRAVKKGGILSVTATDLANLCAARPKACIREYDAKPVRGFFSHETALRILIGRVARTAAVHERGFAPLLSYYEGHHIKTIGRLDAGARVADASIASNGTLGFCEKCFFFTQNGGECGSCHGKINAAGPLWLGKLCDGKTVQEMILAARRGKDAKAEEFLRLLLGENDLGPGFYGVPELCSANRKPIRRKIADIIDALGREGFRAVRTSFTPTGIRTDAKAAQVLRAAIA